jgi:hypothetical protein
MFESTLNGHGADDSARFKLKEANCSLASAKRKAAGTLQNPAPAIRKLPLR